MKTIKFKIILAIGSLILVSIAMVLSTLFTVSDQKNDTHIISVAGKQRMLTQRMSKEFFIYYSDTGEDENVLKIKEKALKKTIALYDKTLDGLIHGDPDLRLPPVSDAASKAQLFKTKKLWDKFKEVFNRGFKDGFFEQEEAFLFSQNIPLLKESDHATQLLHQWTTSKIVRLEQMQYIFLLITIVIGIAVLYLAKILIFNKLNKIITNIDKITRQHDLSSRIKTSPDEIGDLAKGFNYFLGDFQQLLKAVISDNEIVQNSAAKLAEAVSKTEKGAVNQQTQTAQIINAVRHMNDTVAEVADNSEKASGFALEAVEVAEDGGKIVKQTIQSINGIAATVDDSAKIVEVLGHSSNKIGEIIGVIEEIASQTNLLALNAAIEAARAGEQGRGFAVVADEVRTLAKRTSDATDEIIGMVNTIQNDTNKAVVAMQKGSKQVENGVKQANDAGSSLDKIVCVINSVTQMIQQIVSVTEEQLVVASEVRENIESIASISQETVDIAKESASGNQLLSQQVDKLQNKLAKFKLD